ncbi:bifunctional DNA-formamidopyrimidine glycosylase/DNA-(apurinic or apyrimidinic site) lyase [Bacillus pinisoli]|uniref:bifunctional DNA-formamidopyrimidine glycosylase/DNA-(apurinic or apyrimidinic site) lyase n=1 Tax=Bacillus pinisoli TaxID=2901866 RepID=UPI001FF6B0AC|nr:bifunctional DNA-formamidopyrimidine glycosylase/DNA-(apurinic or apyrimidinic site) lyase [Bacillus pinisoli]
MPELPEMENYRRLLSKQVQHKPIVNVTINREKSINVGVVEFQNKVIGQTISKIERRGKHLIFNLQNDYRLLLHLMLGGTMYVGSEVDQPKRTKQVIIDFPNSELFFIGLRLGYLHLLTKEEVEQEFKDLGPEPLDEQFSLEVFKELIGNKKGKLKTTLVDQKFIAGIGNCYSDEICYHAQILPMRKWNELDDKEVRQLFSSIKFVLNRALELGGYMEMPLYRMDQLTGGYNENCFVYDREGETCSRCGTNIIKIELSSRKCFYCPGCQL